MSSISAKLAIRRCWCYAEAMVLSQHPDTASVRETIDSLEVRHRSQIEQGAFPWRNLHELQQFGARVLRDINDMANADRRNRLNIRRNYHRGLISIDDLPKIDAAIEFLAEELKKDRVATDVLRGNRSAFVAANKAAAATKSSKELLKFNEKIMQARERAYTELEKMHDLLLMISADLDPDSRGGVLVSSDSDLRASLGL